MSNYELVSLFKNCYCFVKRVLEHYGYIILMLKVVSVSTKLEIGKCFAYSCFFYA